MKYPFWLVMSHFQLDHDRLAVVANCLVRSGRGSPMLLGSSAVQEYSKRSLFRHSVVPPLPCPQCQLPIGLLPVDRDKCECTVFIVILIAFILVKLEGTVLPRVYMQLNRRLRYIIHMLANRAHRQNGSGTHKQRQMVDRRVNLDRLPARKELPGPEVIPTDALWQVYRASLHYIRQRLRSHVVQHGPSDRVHH